MSDEFHINGDSLEATIKADLQSLCEYGFVEVVGIRDNGDWLYAITDSGRKFLDDGIKSSDFPFEIYNQSLKSIFPNDDE